MERDSTGARPWQTPLAAVGAVAAAAADPEDACGNAHAGACRSHAHHTRTPARTHAHTPVAASPKWDKSSLAAHPPGGSRDLSGRNARSCPRSRRFYAWTGLYYRPARSYLCGTAQS